MKTALAAQGVDVTFTVEATHQCPFKEELDTGTIQVKWRTTSRTVELHSLREHIDTYRDRSVSHEDLVRHHYEQLLLAGVEPVSVEWRGVTAGGTVGVVFREPDRPRA